MATKLVFLALFLLCGGAAGYVTFLKRRLNVALLMLDEQRTKQRSLSASYGRITEQWFPLMDRYPYDSANFRFLGTPIDGVQFEEDRIVFIEFKSNRSELSSAQKKFKRLIETGKVSWEEYHFSEQESEKGERRK